MNFTHIKAFYTVASHGSFTMAAREMNVSQSTLSMQVQSLEKEYNLTFLRRTKKGIELTEEGEILFSYAKRIFSLERELKSTLQDLNTCSSGILTVGSTRLLAHYVLPNIVQALKKNNQGLKLQLYTGLSREVVDRVVNFEYHVSINGRVPYPNNVIYKQISRQRLYFITADQMDDSIQLKDLSNYPIILLEKGSATREYIIKEFACRNIPLNIAIESQNPSAIKNMVHLGMGGAFFPSFAIEEEVREGKFYKVSLRDELFLYYDVIYLEERKKLKSIKSFVSTISESFFPTSLPNTERISQPIAHK